MATLYGIRYSPWSLRAKWALDHHRVPYDYREYVPMLGVPELRVRLGDFRNKITVPVLLDGSTRLRDSLEIARWAEARAQRNAPLFAAHEEAIRTWTNVAEDLAASGRVVSSAATAGDPDAIGDNIPGFIPKPIRPMARPLVKTGIAYLGWKYDFSEQDVDAANVQMRASLETIANRLATSEWLDAEFGWSDIAVVCALQFVQPADGWVRMGRGARKAWTHDELAREFGDVLAWRDRALRERRP